MEGLFSENSDSTMFEVCFQKHPDAEVEKDVAFSQEEAEEAVLEFYNELIQESFDSVNPLQSYEEIELFKSQFAKDIPGKAWLKKIDQPEQAPKKPEESTDVYEFHFPDPTSSHYELFNQLIFNLAETLKQQGIQLPPAKLHEVVSKSFWNSFPEENLLSGPVEQAPEVEQEQAIEQSILLVYVGDQEAAVYMGDEYIDSANSQYGEDLQVIVDTAKMLSEKYEVELKTHRFQFMTQDWSWTRVEQVLKSTGIMPSSRKNLLKLLLDHPTIEMANVVIQGYEIDAAALEKFKTTGEGGQDLLTIQVQRDTREYKVMLTVDEVAKAVEISDHHWGCADQTSTEITLVSSA